jgi:hypothetical protein
MSKLNENSITRNDATAALNFPSSDTVTLETASTERLRVDSSGVATFAGDVSIADKIIHTGDTNTAIRFPSADTIAAETDGSERLRVDSSGRLLVGRTASQNDNIGATGYANIVQIEGAATGAGLAVNNSNGTGRININREYTAVNSDDLGYLSFGAGAGISVERARITCSAEFTNANTYGGQLQFLTCADGAATPTERMRIDNSGHTWINSSDFTTWYPGNSNTETGFFVESDGQVSISRDNTNPLSVNRNTSDGTIINIRQAGTSEGTISVSGSTVSYNGGHLSRWSQLPGGVERTEILRGSVLSNLDEMCEWAYDAQDAVLYTENDELPEGVSVGDVKTPAKDAGTEDNEQLNRMKVSDVEGDKNVSGVFQSWDDDDDTYINDFYCAMTGDFVIRIAQGTTVARGDLLMSAGDGTAKTQDDDIIRSKTIAKVTSTNVSETYADGSYCVPCVLMAC